MEISMSAKTDESRTSPKKGNEAKKGGEKPKTEQASHQGGGGVRSDHRPQGAGTKK
jgi:hypothetical protein